MTRTFRAHFDGRTIVPEQPVDLPTGELFTVRIEETTKVSTIDEMLALADVLNFDKASIVEMNNAIAEDCERVDENGW